MSEAKPSTAEGEAATAVVLAAFRANGALLTAGDRLAAPEGLTSARWQVLGALALAAQPLTVPQIARRMGLSRQSVHASVVRLEADELVETLENPDHRRSHRVGMTELGAARYSSVDTRQAAWADRLAAGLAASDLETTARILLELSDRLEKGLPPTGQAGDGPEQRARRTEPEPALTGARGRES